MASQRKITFRRIRGRLVPIRIRDKVEGGAKVAAGAALGVAGGFGAALSKAFTKAGERQALAAASRGATKKAIEHYRFVGSSLSKQTGIAAALGIGTGIALAHSGLKQSLNKETKQKTNFKQYGSLAAAIGVGAAAALSLKRFSGLGKRESAKHIYKLLKGPK